MKYLWAIIVLVITIGTYLFMAVTQPVVNELISVANTTAAASANISHFPETMAFANAWPLIQWGVPGFTAVILEIIIFKTF